MKMSKVFKSGNFQAVRFLKEFQLHSKMKTGLTMFFLDKNLICIDNPVYEAIYSTTIRKKYPTNVGAG